MNKSRGRQYIDKILINFGRHLVYTEGTKTEKFYVEDLKEVAATKLNVDSNCVEIIHVSTTRSQHTLDLVEFAIKDVNKRRAKGETIDHVWIFYDRDDFKDFDETFIKIKKLNNLPSENKNQIPCDINHTAWHACWSNECFEVWLYLYFENLVNPLSRKQYISKINSFLKARGCNETFKKNTKHPHSFLTKNGGSVQKAIRFAKKKDNNKDQKPNPSSGVYQFAEYIQRYIEDGQTKNRY